MNAMLLEDCCEILDNLRVPITASERKSGPYPYYGANGIQDYVDEYIFDDELVLLAEDGGNFGSKTRPIAYRVSGKCWVNNHAHVLKPKPGLDVDFLCYSLMFYKTDGLVNGATRQKLTQATMRKMLIPNMTLENQRIVVDKLNRVLSIKSKREKQLVKLDELIKARFIEMFGDPISNTKGWNMVELGELTGIGSSKRIFEKEYVSEGIPFYRTKEIVELSKGNNISTELYISEERFAEIKEQYGVPKAGDLLISAVGTIGIIWIVDGKNDFYFKDGNLIRVDGSDTFDSIYMKNLLEHLISEYKKQMSSGTAYAALTISGMTKMKVYDVPLNLQVQFSDFVKQVDKSKVVVPSKIKNAIFAIMLSVSFGQITSI